MAKSCPLAKAEKKTAKPGSRAERPMSPCLEGGGASFQFQSPILIFGIPFPFEYDQQEELS